MMSDKKAPKKAVKKSAEAPPPAPAKEAAPAPKKDKKVHVHHLTRVEGHGNIIVEIDAHDKVQTVRWEVPEAPRFFEAMLSGRSFEEVHQVVSRICGICSIGHQLSSIQATEEALNVRASEQTIIMRKLILHGENMQSHLLHLGYLVLPDLLGVDSVIPLAESHPKELLNLVGLHRLANEFSALIGGRTTHPQRLIPGGMTKLPTEAELKDMKKRLEDSVPGLKAAAEVFATLLDKFPNLQRKTEYVGLVSQAEYPLYWGDVGSTMDNRRPASFYKDLTKEYCVPHSTAKFTKNVHESYMVGALARYNLNEPMLHPLAKKVAGMLGLKAPCHNTFYNNVAQLVEVVHSVEDSIILIDKALSKGLKPEPYPRIQPTAGKGVGAVEVPRGILFHAYEYDNAGKIISADCIIPTNQNHLNIQKDLEELVPMLVDKNEDEIELLTSMLVRAYDPCISCSTHFIDLTGNAKPASKVKFVRV